MSEHIDCTFLLGLVLPRHIFVEANDQQQTNIGSYLANYQH